MEADLVDFLNGLDAKSYGSRDPSLDEPWETMLPEVTNFFIWMLANKQTSFEFALLYSDEWWGPSTRSLTISRLTKIATHAHSLGIRIGVTATVIGPFQQHAYYLVNLHNASIASNRTLASLSIKKHLHLLYDTIGFDYLSSEIGAGEFGSLDCDSMLSYLNETAAVSQNIHHKEIFIKMQS